ncbi:hypothetical protein [Hymenobacter fastidiosus]|uniref:hypothetical protein n=1 Tax=Hymenobacter fastidiosus TaxID=486264 RepID=UPI0031EDB250
MAQKCCINHESSYGFHLELDHRRLVRRQATTRSLVPKPARSGRARYLDADAQAWLVAYVGQHADATLAELGAAWQAQGGRPVGQTCIWQVLDAHRLRRKKKPARRGTRPEAGR